MIDHIICYESAAHAPAGDGACWLDQLGRTWMPVDCIIADAVYDGDGAVISPAVHAPGVWMVVRANAVQDDLLADPRCLIVSDSDLAAVGQPFVLVSRLEATTLLGAISPVFAGDSYPFPTGPASNLVPLMVAG